jgi:uncharacterized protein (UPF0335 family)
MINSDLRARCEAIARLEIQRKELADEVKRLKEKAKSDGFDAALITKTVAVMLKPAARQKQVIEQHSLFDNYLMAVGLLPDDGGDDRENVKKTATRYDQEDTANLVQRMADDGLISQKAADETRAIAQAINDKWGDGKKLAVAHDPETGEITDTEPAVNRQPLGTAAATGEGASVDAAAPAATNSEPNISTAPGLDDGTDTAAVDQQSPAAATTPETPPSNVPRIAAGQVADAVHAGAASVTDQSADLEIPAFLRRVKPGDAHGFRNSNVRSGFGPDASPALQTEVA